MGHMATKRKRSSLPTSGEAYAMAKATPHRHSHDLTDTNPSTCEWCRGTGSLEEYDGEECFVCEGEGRF